MSHYLVITGASRGIGKSTALLFQQSGWKVINISRNACDLSDVKNFSIDLSIAGWQKKHGKALQEATADAKRICLVHNAAFYHKDNIVNLEDELLRKIFESNLIAPIILNQIFLPRMAADSSILYIGSGLSEKAVANTASYVISKHAFVGMMRSTCQDLDGTGVHTACICPGFTDTEMLKAHAQHDTDILSMMANKTMMKRLITPLEIAKTIYFCAENPVINGSILHANLGQIET